MMRKVVMVIYNAPDSCPSQPALSYIVVVVTNLCMPALLRGLEPDEFDDPADYLYTQRPAKARDVDTESRCSMSSDDQTPGDTAGSGVSFDNNHFVDKIRNVNNSNTIVKTEHRHHRAVHTSAFSSLTTLEERAVGGGRGTGRSSPASSSPIRAAGRQSPGVSSLGTAVRAPSASGSSSPASSISGRRSPVAAAAAETVMFRGRPITPTHKPSSVSAPASLRHGGGRSLSDSASDDAASLRSLENGDDCLQCGLYFYVFGSLSGICLFQSLTHIRCLLPLVGNPTVFYDDLKLSRPSLFLPSNSLPTSRSSSSVGSDYSNNPKYRTQKPPWARSELELFRSRGERYSIKRKQSMKSEDKEQTGNDEEKPGPASSTLVRPDGRKVSVCTPSNKWIVHWHELLRRRKSLEEMAKLEDKQNGQEETASGSPILRVSPPTPSPASSLVKLDTLSAGSDRFDSDLSNTVFDLVRRKDGGRGSLPHGKNSRQNSLTPPGGHSRQDSTSSVESISALVMAAQERQAVARLPSVDLDELTLSGNEGIASPVEGIPIPIIKRQDRRSLTREGNVSDSSDEIQNRRKVRPRRSGSRTPSPTSSRGSRPATPVSLHGSQSHSPILSRSPCSSPSGRQRSPGDKPILPSKLKLTTQGFRPMLADKQDIRVKMEEIQNCPCGGLHPNGSPPIPILSSSPKSDDMSPVSPTELNGTGTATPPLLARDTSYMPPTPLPEIETPPLEKRTFDLSPDTPPMISTPELTRARRAGAPPPALPASLPQEQDRQGRRLLPAPGVVVAAKARAQAAAEDNYDMRSDSKEAWRREKVKLLPSTRSVSMSSQDGQPETRPRRESHTRTVGGQSVTVIPAKGKTYSSSSLASSSDEEESREPRLSRSTKSLTQESNKTKAKGEPPVGALEGRRDSCSSFVSYTAESVRSNSSATNIDPSSDDSLSNHRLHEYQHTPRTGNIGMKPAYSQSSLHSRGSHSSLHSKDTQADSRDFRQQKPTETHDDRKDTKPGSKDLNYKPSPSISSKFRFGRKNKSKENEVPPTKDSNQKTAASNSKGKDKAKGGKSKISAGKNPEPDAKRSDSFEEVYDSNVNRLLETMKGSTMPNLGRGKEKKPRWEDVKAKPGPTGKSTSLMFQQSLSLSEELAENAKWYRMSDDNDDDNLDFVVENKFFDRVAENNLPDVDIDDNFVAKATRVEGLLSLRCHQRTEQQLSGEEGNMASKSTQPQEMEVYAEETRKEAPQTTSLVGSSDNLIGLKTAAVTKVNTETHDLIESKQESVEQKNPEVRSLNYFEQHAVLLSRTPDWEIPESMKIKLCRAGSTASDTLSVIQEASESDRGNVSVSSNDQDLTSVSSEEDNSDDTLFGCVSDDSLSDDTRPDSLSHRDANILRGSRETKVGNVLEAQETHDVNCTSIVPNKKLATEDSVLLVFDDIDDGSGDKKEISETNLELDSVKKNYNDNETSEEVTTESFTKCSLRVSCDKDEATILEDRPELDNDVEAQKYQREDISQKGSLVSLADSNPECDVLESSEELDKVSQEDTKNELVLGAEGVTTLRAETEESDMLYPTCASPPLASSCSVDNSPEGSLNNDDVVDSAEAADDDGDDSNSSHTSAGSGGRKETLLQMALRVEKENRLLEKERAERAKEKEERRKLEAAAQRDDMDHLTPPSKLRRDPDNDSLTSGHLSISSRDEAGQSGGGGFFSRLKNRSRRKGYPSRNNSVTKPRKK
ncbi:hypothetical protein ElyMa_004689100 [Elysia marginata]|uniref:Uncharacterized protein n=1 Tax=Elysia marginata TaxID=1093978 RepID=A0AAV4I8B3_9GAST|nr:hypothetical protein ElyMa_004689100 [Elysia marginata]